jgi:hypothetical protein
MGHVICDFRQTNDSGAQRQRHLIHAELPAFVKIVHRENVCSRTRTGELARLDPHTANLRKNSVQFIFWSSDMPDAAANDASISIASFSLFCGRHQHQECMNA